MKEGRKGEGRGINKERTQCSFLLFILCGQSSGDVGLGTSLLCSVNEGISPGP